uniref:Ig-like domain-containing protein n=1 Tax=Amphiprion percula TaxID=161767 RepID=A0A3P8THE7_AMPPE
MASTVLVFYLTCLLFGDIAQTTGPTHQGARFISANVGGNVTLECFYGGDVATRLYWYKQPLGQKPRVISNFYMYKTDSTFYDEFKNNSRFQLDSDRNKNHLTITDLRASDSATYFCLNSHLYMINFSESVTVSVEGSGLNFQTSVQQSVYDAIQPGGSVNLSCTVQTEICDGKHSVYWFRSEEDSHPGLIYSHGGRGDLCERKPNTKTQTCVYTLPVSNSNPTHAGIYYCAVASCGRILFGVGTKMIIDGSADDVNFAAYFWRGAFALVSFLSVLMAFSVCLMNRNHSCKSPESQAKLSPTADAKGHQQGESIYYAAVSANLTNRSRSQRDHTWSDCVYYNLKQ